MLKYYVVQATRLTWVAEQIKFALEASGAAPQQAVGGVVEILLLFSSSRHQEIKKIFRGRGVISYCFKTVF